MEPKIGHLVSLGIGGADRAALHLILGLKDIGQLPTVFVGPMSFPSKDSITDDQDPAGHVLSIEEEYAKEGINLVRVESATEIQQHDIDILHTHRSGEDHWLLPGLDEGPHSFKVCETNFHGVRNSYADVRVFPSESLVKHRNIKVDSVNIVIPNPVFRPCETDSYAGLRENGHLFYLGRVSRSDRSVFSPKLLIAYKILRAISRNFRLVWVGDSSMARNWAKFLGLDDIIWVSTVSNQCELSKWYGIFDLYCHVNPLGETFGNTVAEAMMHGKPCVTWPGKRSYPQAQIELLGDPSQVVHSMTALIRLILNLQSDKSKALEVGARNKVVAAERFDRLSIARAYAEVYRTILGEERHL